MRIGRVASEPWREADNLNELEDAPAISRLPLNIAIASDRKTVHLDDCVDYISPKTLTRQEVMDLAWEFASLASLME
jgi:hypothetical protein